MAKVKAKKSTGNSGAPRKQVAKKQVSRKPVVGSAARKKEEFSLETLLNRVGGGDLSTYKKVAAVLAKYSEESGVVVEFMSFKYGEVYLKVASSKARLVRLDKEKLIALINKKIGDEQCLSIRVGAVKG